MIKEELIEYNQFVYVVDKVFTGPGIKFYSEVQPKNKCQGAIWADLRTKEVKVYQESEDVWMAINGFVFSEFTGFLRKEIEEK